MRSLSWLAVAAAVVVISIVATSARVEHPFVTKSAPLYQYRDLSNSNFEVLWDHHVQLVNKAPQPAPVTSEPIVIPPDPGGPVVSGEVVLSVPLYFQAYALSCEAASLRMALAYRGIKSSEEQILELEGADPRPADFSSGVMRWGNPNREFVGRVNGSEVALTGYGVYAPVIERVARSLGATVWASGSLTPNELYQDILTGHPAVVWITYDYIPRQAWSYQSFDGASIIYTGPVEHAVTVIGVKDGIVVLNDPHAGQVQISKALFEAIWATYEQMAVVL